jgi:hypothetical protein
MKPKALALIEIRTTTARQMASSKGSSLIGVENELEARREKKSLHRVEFKE